MAEEGRGRIAGRGGGGGGWRGCGRDGGSQPQRARDIDPVGAGRARSKGVDELRKSLPYVVLLGTGWHRENEKGEEIDG